MGRLLLARAAIFILIVMFVISAAFYALTPDREDKPCPPDRPVLVEDFSCVSKDFHEGTFEPRSEAGQK